MNSTTTTTDPLFDPRPTTEVRMITPEELFRLRNDELLAEADRQRLVRRFAAGRWWRRLADYASRRAERAYARAS
ncbi:hypothetical protein GCM10011581_05400 [Saccharopolyspora subtropica]|uniref:Uncharacterized protein n=1 Tax=Saccharopolyspora thermophila TaxID=89367 RepID=A0A917N6Z4_9PSEU|nr:hypothetical protein [Saccharopolyspora subtropica]GGI71313.1 hypothetical protein GCM10011581_05400 [Saccharopolyspora subtropica]